MDEKTHEGQDGQDVAIVRVAVPMSKVQPHEKHSEGRNVDHGVEAVGQLDQPSCLQHQPLQAQLARKVQPALEVPYPEAMRGCARDVRGHEGPDELPHGVKAGDEGHLDGEGSSPDPRTAAPSSSPPNRPRPGSRRAPLPSSTRATRRRHPPLPGTSREGHILPDIDASAQIASRLYPGMAIHDHPVTVHTARFEDRA